MANVLHCNMTTETPLYFVRSGIVLIDTNKLTRSGLEGYYWSSMGGYGNAYALNISNGVRPSDSFTYTNNRYTGYPLRCLAS